MALPGAKVTMRISAPGSCSFYSLRDRPVRNQGFTLIELLVVLVVMGVALGMVAVQLMPDDSSRLRQSGEQLALLLENAGLEARSSGVAMAWVGRKTRYQFFQRDEQGLWQSVDGGSFRARELEEGVSIAAVELDGKPVELGTRLPLSATSFASPFNIKLSAGAAVLFVVGDGIGRVSITQDKEANAPAAN